MSKVVYRGVEYDTEKRLQYQQQMQQQPQQYNEIYRGVKFVKKEGGEGMKSINILQLIKEQKQKQDRRHKASIAHLIQSR